MKQKTETITAEDSITYIHPCTEKGKVAAEITLKKGFDAKKMCRKLEKTKEFSGLQTSADLGVAKFYCMSADVIVFKDGRINIRKCSDRETLLKILEKIKKVLR